jgi:adenylate kinase
VSINRAILLIGPSGVGKTPLGEALERRGLLSARCLHFDFGAELRRAAAGRAPGFSGDEVAHLAEVLRSGRLLEDRDFPIARRILDAFLAGRGCGPEDVCVLNGLPRHTGQARDLEAVLEVRLVVHLSCRPEVAWERIRTNAGGDRTGRADDDLDSVRRRLDLFAERAEPLIAHYRGRGTRVETVAVEASTATEDIRQRLESALALNNPLAGQ